MKYLTWIPILLVSAVVGLDFRGPLYNDFNHWPDLEPNPKEQYKAHTIQVPRNHFPEAERYHWNKEDTFGLRYWYNATFYHPGGPVILFLAGDVDAEERLVVMEKGILAKLARELNGLAVVLEHRYYGQSFPFEDLSKTNMRLLSTEQGMTDAVYFARNARFPDIAGVSAAPDTPYILYGASYAGSLVSFLMAQHSGIFVGGISSSGVLEARTDFWQYWDAVRKYGPLECVERTAVVADVIGKIMMQEKHKKLRKKLKSVFNLMYIEDNRDAAYLMSYGVAYWQDRNWDPQLGSNTFDQYCSTVASSNLQGTSSEDKRRKDVGKFLDATGYTPTYELETSFLNFISFTRHYIGPQCSAHGPHAAPHDQCITPRSRGYWKHDGLDAAPRRSWLWQQCTEWGLFASSAGTPPDVAPVLSRSLDASYLASTCQRAFGLDLEDSPPAVGAVNRLAEGVHTTARLAAVAGEFDPWRPLTQLADADADGAYDTNAYLIPAAGHAWDMTGSKGDGSDVDLPQNVRDAQDWEVAQARAWMDERRDKGTSQAASETD